VLFSDPSWEFGHESTAKDEGPRETERISQKLQFKWALLKKADQVLKLEPVFGTDVEKDANEEVLGKERKLANRTWRNRFQVRC
jgi:hypothetical protein